MIAGISNSAPMKRLTREEMFDTLGVIGSGFAPRDMCSCIWHALSLSTGLVKSIYMKIIVYNITPGTYGVVEKVKDKHNSQIFAFKRPKKLESQDGIPQSVIREIAVLKEVYVF